MFTITPLLIVALLFALYSGTKPVKKKCVHGFDPIDVVNLKIDPKCVYCGKTLSECNKELTL